MNFTYRESEGLTTAQGEQEDHSSRLQFDNQEEHAA